MTKSTQKQQKNSSNELPHYALMALFGLAYNRAIEEFEEQTDSDALTSITVAVGVGVTLILSVPVVGRRAVTKTFLSFVATGLPMIYGHLLRWKRRNDIAGSVIGGREDTEKRTRSKWRYSA